MRSKIIMGICCGCVVVGILIGLYIDAEGRRGEDSILSGNVDVYNPSSTETVESSSVSESEESSEVSESEEYETTESYDYDAEFDKLKEWSETEGNEVEEYKVIYDEFAGTEDMMDEPTQSMREFFGTYNFSAVNPFYSGLALKFGTLEGIEMLRPEGEDFWFEFRVDDERGSYFLLEKDGVKYQSWTGYDTSEFVTVFFDVVEED